jgi:hypothetical protein
VSGTINEPLARRIRPGDWGSLSQFACSKGAWYEADVERFVRTRLRGHVQSREPHLQTSCVILADAADPAEILAVGAHEFDDQRTEDGQDIEGSYLILGAVRADLQGALVDMKTFADQRPVTLGRLLMETMVDDLPDRPGVVRAVVAQENHRALKLCDRIGLVHERADADPRFVQRLGTFD